MQRIEPYPLQIVTYTVCSQGGIRRVHVCETTTKLRQAAFAAVGKQRKTPANAMAKNSLLIGPPFLFVTPTTHFLVGGMVANKPTLQSRKAGSCLSVTPVTHFVVGWIVANRGSLNCETPVSYDSCRPDSGHRIDYQLSRTLSSSPFLDSRVD